MIVVLDMDDVFTRTNQHWVDRYNEDWDECYTLEDVKGWNMHTWVKPECEDLIYDYLKEPGFYRGLLPIEGAIEGAKFLIDMGHDVVIASASPIESPLAIEEKKSWLREHMPFFNLKNFFPIHRKELIAGDILFDDGAHNLKDFRGISICMDRPWNRGEDCCEERVKTWAEFMKIIMKMKIDHKYLNLLKHNANNRWAKHYFDDNKEEWRHEQH